MAACKTWRPPSRVLGDDHGMRQGLGQSSAWLDLNPRGCWGWGQGTGWIWVLTLFSFPQAWGPLCSKVPVESGLATGVHRLV